MGVFNRSRIVFDNPEQIRKMAEPRDAKRIYPISRTSNHNLEKATISSSSCRL